MPDVHQDTSGLYNTLHNFIRTDLAPFSDITFKSINFSYNTILHVRVCTIVSRSEHCTMSDKKNPIPKRKSKKCINFHRSFLDDKLELQTEFEKACKKRAGKLFVPSMFKWNLSSLNRKQHLDMDSYNLHCLRTRQRVLSVVPRSFPLPQNFLPGFSYLKQQQGLVHQ